MRRFRLLSLLVAMLTASALIGVNLRGQWILQPGPYFGSSPGHRGKWNYGWPATVYSYQAGAIFWTDFPAETRAEFEAFVTAQTKLVEEGENEHISKIVRRTEGVYGLESNPEFRRWALGVNIVAVLGITLSVLLIFELLWLRSNERRELIQRWGRMRFFEFRLISIGAGCVIVSACTVLNVRGQWSESSFSYGWPFSIAMVEASPYIRERMTDEEWEKFLKSAEWDGASKVRRGSDGTVRIFSMYRPGPVDYWSVGMNIVLLFACSTIALTVCEYFLRRHDARSKPEVSI